MSDADTAFARAQEKIERARMEGAQRLNFDSEELRAVDRLPEEIGALTALRVLVLDDTNVSDLAPLAGLTSLMDLRLNGTGVKDLTPLSGLIDLEMLTLNETGVTDLKPLSELTGLTDLLLDETPVMDLRPLRGLEKLVEKPENPFSFGLTFTNCAAAEADPKIGEIAEIRDQSDRARALFDYLEDWVPPVPVDAIPDQNPSGFAFALNEDGQIALSAAAWAHDAQTEQLHAILRSDVAEVLEMCPTGTQAAGYGRVHQMLERYQRALADPVDRIVPPVLWNAGNKLRLELASDAVRTGTALDDQPKLPGDVRDAMEALVQVHNAFVSGHATLAALDEVRDDPLDRHRADLDRERMAAFLTALEEQTRLIVDAVFEEFGALHAQAVDETAAGMRALCVERDSLDNLINHAVREALIQERHGPAQDLAGDSRAAAVGVVMQDAAKTAAPFVAATFPQLVTVLQPHMAALLASTHGADYPVKQALDYVVWRLKRRSK